MNRRQFVRNAGLLGATTGLTGLPKGWPAPVAEGNPSLQEVDLSDRSPNRDPWAVQRSTLVVEGLIALGVRESHLKAQKAGGVNCGVQGGPMNPATSGRAYKFFDEHKDELAPVTTVRGIREAHRQGKIAQVFNWQSAEALGNQFNSTFGSAEIPLRGYYEMGLRIVGIAYNVANLFGGGCLEPHVGLTLAGRRLVETIHKLRIVLDVGGHTGEQTSLDAVAMSGGIPVICTHTNVKALNDNPRCVSDRVIEAIAGTGGVIGLTAVSDFLKRSRKDVKVPISPRATVEDYLDQIEYIRKRVGADHVGLGPDFVAGGNVDYGNINPVVLSREIFSDGPWRYVEGFEDISELPNITRGLIRRGWSTGDIHKFLGANWLRVYEKVWGA